MTRKEAYKGGQKLQTYVRVEYYTREEDGEYSPSPLIWNLPVKKCYLLDSSNIQGEMVIAPSKAESLYITTDTNPETERDKVIFLKDLDIKIEDKDIYVCSFWPPL